MRVIVTHPLGAIQLFAHRPQPNYKESETNSTNVF